MKWSVIIKKRVLKTLAKIPASDRNKIMHFLEKELPDMENPRIKGEPLHGDLNAFWKYRFGNYRLVCEIIDKEIAIFVMMAGDRRDVYEFAPKKQK